MPARVRDDGTGTALHRMSKDVREVRENAAGLGSSGPPERLGLDTKDSAGINTRFGQVARSVGLVADAVGTINLAHLTNLEAYSKTVLGCRGGRVS